MITEEKLLTVAEVADTLRIRPQTVRALVNSGRLPAIQVNLGEQKRQLRFRPADVQGWLNERVVGRR